MVANSYPPSPLLEVNCLMPLALPSPLHPLPAKRAFIYTQTTFTCLLLLSGTITCVFDRLLQDPLALMMYLVATQGLQHMFLIIRDSL
jgi:hypothetical protein